MSAAATSRQGHEIAKILLQEAQRPSEVPASVICPCFVVNDRPQPHGSRLGDATAPSLLWFSSVLGWLRNRNMMAEINPRHQLPSSLRYAPFAGNYVQLPGKLFLAARLKSEQLIPLL